MSLFSRKPGNWNAENGMPVPAAYRLLKKAFRRADSLKRIRKRESGRRIPENPNQRRIPLLFRKDLSFRKERGGRMLPGMKQLLL